MYMRDAERDAGPEHRICESSGENEHITFSVSVSKRLAVGARAGCGRCKLRAPSIRKLRVRKRRISEPKFLGNTQWTSKIRPLNVRICLRQTL